MENTQARFAKWAALNKQLKTARARLKNESTGLSHTSPDLKAEVDLLELRCNAALSEVQLALSVGKTRGQSCQLADQT